MNMHSDPAPCPATPAQLAVMDSTFADLTALRGPAIDALDRASVSLTANTFTGLRSLGLGGAVYAADTQAGTSRGGR